jgi:hypothetical protein
MLIRRGFKYIGNHLGLYAFFCRKPKPERQLHQLASIQADALFSLRVLLFNAGRYDGKIAPNY